MPGALLYSWEETLRPWKVEGTVEETLAGGPGA